jgi:uncharacterized protein YukE
VGGVVVNSSKPTPQEIHVALEALRDDADHWRTAADALRASAGRARDALVPPATFSFAGQAAAAAYEALRARTARLLEEGALNFDDIATALRASAAAYEADEKAHRHRIENIY